MTRRYACETTRSRPVASIRTPAWKRQPAARAERSPCRQWAAPGGTSAIPDASLTSDVFGSAAGGAGPDEVPAEDCDYSNAGCDWTRVVGCCRAMTCERASGYDVFNTYPVESCKALVACVQGHSGCSSASDPLCFQNEDPSAPCLQQGYQASHLDPEGPFAWTKNLVACVCGY